MKGLEAPPPRGADCSGAIRTCQARGFGNPAKDLHTEGSTRRVSLIFKARFHPIRGFSAALAENTAKPGVLWIHAPGR